MKFFLLLGGLLGFAVVYAGGMVVGKQPSETLVQACFGSVVAGLMFRWIALIWIRNVKQMLMEKQQTAIAELAEAEERRRQGAKEHASKPV